MFYKKKIEAKFEKTNFGKNWSLALLWNHKILTLFSFKGWLKWQTNHWREKSNNVTTPDITLKMLEQLLSNKYVSDGNVKTE